jgi:hypothetical protein
MPPDFTSFPGTVHTLFGIAKEANRLTNTTADEPLQGLIRHCMAVPPGWLICPPVACPVLAFFATDNTPIAAGEMMSSVFASDWRM